MDIRLFHLQIDKALEERHHGIIIGEPLTNDSTNQSLNILNTPKDLPSEDLTSITIPSSVISIGKHEFYGRTSLTSITIPSSVTSIGVNAFRGCTGLTSMTIPSSVTLIGEYAFFGCTGLTSITISSSVTSIGVRTFFGCTGLTSITIHSGVTSIEMFAFYGCTGLTSITIPSSVTSIGEYAFYGCSKLTHILINTDKPEELERIKKLLPEDVREKAINPARLKAKQIRRQLLVDFSATIYPDAKPFSFSSSFLCDVIIKEICSYNELTTKPVLSLKKALEKEPVPDSDDFLTTYEVVLKSIERQHVFFAQRDTLVASLQRYNEITKEGLPSQSSGFFAGRQTPSNANNVAILAVYNLVERLIDSLRHHRVPALSSAEQDTLFSRPHLLAKIPLDIREAMGFDVQQTHQTLPAPNLL